jgi:FMN-dependent NADH-azoreductase
MKLLHIDSSITGANSVSRKLTARIVERLKASQPGLEVSYRDLAVDPVPHHTGEIMLAKAAGAAAPDHQPAFDAINAVLEDFMAADIVVLGAPMYNFSIPSQLKAWMDCLAVPGRTFRYSQAGVEGLAGGKRLIVASARGNIYTSTPFSAFDHQETYIASFFGFIGVTDIEFVRAEGIMLGPDVAAPAIEAALAHADAL